MVQEALAMRRQIELSNEVAAALDRHRATRSCARSRSHLDCDVYLRGNLVTLDGDAEAVAERARPSCASSPS